jgi:hypothetical protein
MTTRKVFTIIVGTVVILAAYQLSLSHDLTLNNTPVQLYFSPNGGCTDAIVKEINNSKTGILVQAYSFTSTPM